MRDRVLDFLSERGTLADEQAVEYLLTQADPLGAADRVLRAFPDPPFVITLEDIRRAVGIARAASERAFRDPPAAPRAPVPPGSIRPSFRETVAPASDVAEDVRILKDITGHSTCEGTLADFGRYFRHRFATISRLLRSRPELSGAMEMSRAKKLTRDTAIIGMVTEARTTKNGHRILEIEDETDSVSVLLPADSSMASDAIVNDEVVGVTGRSNDRGLFIAKSLVHPDLPISKAFPGTAAHIRVGFMSDIHVGSRTFLADRWAKFRAWACDGDEVARSLRYLVLSGDVVDGIGVYPRQDEELVLDDIYAQYEALSAMLPALPAAIQKLFDSNVTFVGNPVTLSLHGVRILAYHGRSMDDFVSAVPALSYARPLDAMREMLRKRHLAPIYGGKTPIAPESEDHLIIDQVPDVFVTGHVHAAGVGEHRGVVLVNSSTWQAQTSFQ
ncbi:MAG: hypothetical protein E6G55_12740, partial [Actinobacteria bacterium]